MDGADGQALDEAQLPPDVTEFLREFFGGVATMMVNRGGGQVGGWQVVVPLSNLPPCPCRLQAYLPTCLPATCLPARYLPMWAVRRHSRTALRWAHVYRTLQSIADAVAAAAPSVVQVHGRRRPASGLVYADGIVVTTMRAVGREDGLRVRTHAGDTLEATLAGWDPATSLAVLQVPGLAAPAVTPSAAPARVGHLALAVARSWSNAVTASAGMVAVIGGPLPTGRRRAIDQVIRTTAPMHDGFSGGAFLDASGALIGVDHGGGDPRARRSSFRPASSGRPRRTCWSTAGLPAAISASSASPSSCPSAQRGRGRERALLVASVRQMGRPRAAGVLIGDVILSLDGTPVASPEDLLDLLTGSRVGRSATLQLLRGGCAEVDVGRVTIGAALRRRV